MASKIEWTDETWNPVRGCHRISPGCENCYAERQAIRFSAPGKAYEGLVKTTAAGPRWTGEVRMLDDMLDVPRHWRKPRVVFVDSMGDYFHDDVPAQFIRRGIDVMRETPQHIYQILTKRAERLEQIDPEIAWPDNVWMGVSVENEKYGSRINHLRRTHARIKFLSLEPLLGALPDLNLNGIDWVIVGGESGPGARPIQENWVTDIRDRCVASGTPFFFKQWGGVRKKLTGRLLDGRTWDEMPDRDA